MSRKRSHSHGIIVFTTFPESSFTASEVLEWHRIRWQIELVFKRFKLLAHLGHLPKYDDGSAKAWLYGKLFVALLVEKVIRHTVAVFPWRYELEASSTAPERTGVALRRVAVWGYELEASSTAQRVA